MKDFRKDRYQGVLDLILEEVDEAKLYPLEIAYLTINFMLAMGASLYDKDPTNIRSIKHDYKLRPTAGGAIILGADGLHKVMQMIQSGPLEDDEWEQLLPTMVREIAGSKAASSLAAKKEKP